MFPTLKTVLLTAASFLPMVAPAGAQTIDGPTAAAAATSTAGEIRGPQIGVGAVPAFSTHTYRLTFRGGEIARIVVLGSGRTDLDLYVYDQNGNLIASDSSGSDRCIVQWTPLWTGPFRVRVVNRGAASNLYRLLTN